MRSPRFAYKKEEQNNVEILEALTKHAFPLTNELVRHCSSQSSDWFQCCWFMSPQIHLLLFLFQSLFAFQYKEQFPEDGWKVYDPVAEYKRMVRFAHC